MKRISAFFLSFLWCGSVYAAEFAGWGEIYRQTAEIYVYPVSVEDLASAGLKGMAKVDKNLRLGNDASRMTLYYKGNVVKVLRKPSDKNDASIWGKITETMIETAVQKSKKAAGRDFEINDILAAEMITALDKDSKFYHDVDEANGRKKAYHKRQFAARAEDDVLYVKILSFNKQTVSDLKQALQEYSAAKALILDLRNCPGGMLGEAVKTADMFLAGGIIASTKGKIQNEEIFYTADKTDVWNGKPVIVLTDADTASAAEVVAGALQDQGRAKIIGTTTKGKGSVQKLIGLDNGSVLAVTGSFFMTPSGKVLHEKGIVPDICTFEMPESKDIGNLMRQQNGRCDREKREDSLLEMAVAKAVLE